MCLKVENIMKIMEQFAPLNLKESYDNVGLMVGDPNCKVTSILVALDCTLKVIEEAKQKGCNFILTHHPLLFKKPTSITRETLVGNKIINLIKNNINVYSSHTNLDSVKGGINDLAMRLMDFNNYKIVDLNNDNDMQSGIGRIVTLSNEITLENLCEKVKEAFNIISLRYVGEDTKKIKKVALINGSGNDYLQRAKKLGADCVITGDTTYHYVSDLNEEGVAIIDAGHFATEWPSMKIVGKWLENRIKFMGYSNNVIISTETIEPYKYR